MPHQDDSVIIPLQHRRALRLDAPECEWLATRTNRQHGEALLRYATMLNTLDAKWLKGCLAPQITYESQSVLETLHGPTAVFDYLDRKMQAIVASGSQGLMIAEIATLPGSKDPVVAICQARRKSDRDWREAPVGLMEMTTDEGGLIASMLMITTVPSPHLAKGCGLMPGFSGETKKPPVILHRAGDYRGLLLHLIQLDGLCPLDRDAETALQAAARWLPGAKVKVEAHRHDPKWLEENMSWCGHGFPCLGLFWEGDYIGRMAGYRSTEEIMEKIRQCVG